MIMVQYSCFWVPHLSSNELVLAQYMRRYIWSVAHISIREQSILFNKVKVKVAYRLSQDSETYALAAANILLY